MGTLNTIMSPAWLVALPLAGAVAVSAWQAWRSGRGGLRRPLVLAGNLGAAILVWLLLFAQETGPVETVVLVTPGLDDRTLRPLPAEPQAWAIQSVDATEWRRFPPRFAADPASVAALAPGEGPIRILGMGLGAPYWRGYAGRPLIFEPGEAPPGIIGLDWPRRLRFGETLELDVQATRAEEDRRLVLQDRFGRHLAGATLPAKGERISLSTTFPAPGAYRLRLTLEDLEGNVLDGGPVPVSVSPSRRVGILLLWNAPSFEGRQLQRWLESADGPLAARTTLSRKRHLEQFNDLPKRDLSRIDRPLLAEFDLVIADARAFLELSRSEIEALGTEIEETGLGLLVLADGAVEDMPAWLPEIVAVTPDSRPITLSTRMFGGRVPPLRDVGAAISQDPADRPVISDDEARVLAAWRPRGEGRVGLSLLRGTYVWVTSGRPGAYGQLWQILTAAVGRAESAPPRLSVGTPLPQVGERVELCVESPNRMDDMTVTPTGLRDSGGDGAPGNAAPTPVRVRLASSAPGRSCGYYWPRAPGWHRTEHGDHASSWYVFEATDWRVMRDHEARRATLAMAQAARMETSLPATSANVSAWLWLVILTAVLGALWLEQKFFEGSRKA